MTHRRSQEEDRSKNHQFCIPSSEVIAKAVEKTIDDGLWAKGTCWSVVYVVYRILGYEGSVSDYVREVESWKFAKPIIYKCNRDSVGKPLRDKRMTYNLYVLKSPESFLTQGFSYEKDGGLLLSRIALQYHRRRRA